MLKRKHFHHCQKHAGKKIRKHKRCVLWKDMGLGKTVTALTAFMDADAFPTLVVAPPGVAKNVWHNEVKKWKHLKHLTVIPVIGLPRKRVELLRTPADVHVLSSGSIKWYAQYCNQFHQGEPLHKSLIIDESGQYRSHTTVRTKIAQQLSLRMKRVLMMTASPMPNGPQDLFSQYLVLDNGKRLYKAHRDFLDKWFDQNQYNHVIKVKSPKHERKIIKRVSDVTFRYDAKDYLDMPELVKTIIPVSLAAKKQQEYDKLERDFFLNLEEGEIDAVNALVLAGKLQQFANGTVRQKMEEEVASLGDIDELIEEDDSKLKPTDIVHQIHNEKIEALDEIIEGLGSKNLIIAYSHRADRDKILNSVKGSVHFKGQQKLYDKWNSKPNTGQRLVCHPASVGHGLNLQDGGNTIIKFAMVRSYELYEQAIGRIYRQGQSEGKVFVYHLVTQNTIDEDIYTTLQGRGFTQDRLMKQMKKRNEK